MPYNDLEVMGVNLDNISISELCGSSLDRIGTFSVSYRVVQIGQYWARSFMIRNSAGNVRELGRMMGIGTRDKRISRFSQSGMEIGRYLHRIAWKYAGSLARGKQEVTDNTAFGQAKRAIERLEKLMAEKKAC